MRPPGFQPPGWRMPPDLERKVLKSRRAQGLISDSHIGEEDKPLKFRVPNIPLHRSEKWQKRKKKGMTERPEGYELRKVWRLKGRFTKKPEIGERARMLKLPGSELK